MQSKDNIEMAAVRHLPQSVRQKIQKLYDDGTIRVGDLDPRSILNMSLVKCIPGILYQYMADTTTVYSMAAFGKFPSPTEDF